MTDLIKISRDDDGEATVSGRELHQALKITTRYNDWFNRMLEFGFIEGEDFYSILSKSAGGRRAIDHQLTIDMAKEICMLQRTPQGRIFRRYFIEVETAYWQKVKTIYTLPFNTPMDLKGSEIVIYSIISNDSSAYNYSIRDYANKTNLSKSTVVNILKSLLVKGYISKDIEYINHVKYCHYKIAE